jgi:hypothetical protein
VKREDFIVDKRRFGSRSSQPHEILQARAIDMLTITGDRGMFRINGTRCDADELQVAFIAEAVPR